MGALLTCFATSCACSTASCCASAVCNCCGKAIPFGTAVKTRLLYVVLFLLSIISCWVFVTWGADWYDKIPAVVFDKNFCTQHHCFGALSVYRISFGLAVFHGVQSLLMLGVRTTADCRAWIQNGFWLFKALALVGLMVGAFFIPMDFYVYYGWAALVCSVLFLFIQLVLLVDFAHSWSESWLGKYNEDPTQIIWMRLLMLATILIFVAALAAVITMYVLFASSAECGINAVFITLALLSGIALSCLAVHPKVQEKSPHSGLLQPAVVFFYMTFLVWSAIMSEPFDSTVFSNNGVPCNQLPGNHTDGTWGTGNQKFGTLMGVLLVVVAVCYSALRASTQHDTLMGKVDEATPIAGSQSIDDVAAAADGKPVASDADVAEPAAPAAEPVGYNYSFFHLIFMLASMYICMLMTNWSVVKGSDIDVDNMTMMVGATIDQSEASVWIKAASSWFVALLFAWSLIAPVVFGDREFK
jgi:serine incorporator 1/3